MKLDLELMRKIMLELEELPAGEIVNDFKMEGYEDIVVYEHLHLLQEDDRPGSGDGERETPMTRQTPYEPLPASGWFSDVGEKSSNRACAL